MRAGEQVEVFADVAALGRAAAERVTTALSAAIAARGVAHLVLAGGSTPVQVYERLAAEPSRSAVDWSRVELWFGDERAVPPDDPASNYGMVERSLLAPLGLSGERVHRMRGELPAEEAAALYEDDLAASGNGDASPRFDVVLLGVGADGHVASLFPDTPVGSWAGRRAVATSSPLPPHPRISLTPAVLERTGLLLFLVAGESKAEVVGTALAADPARRRAVVAGKLVAEGTMVWLLDEAAARELGRA